MYSATIFWWKINIYVYGNWVHVLQYWASTFLTAHQHMKSHLVPCFSNISDFCTGRQFCPSIGGFCPGGRLCLGRLCLFLRRSGVKQCRDGFVRNVQGTNSPPIVRMNSPGYEKSWNCRDMFKYGHVRVTLVTYLFCWDSTDLREDLLQTCCVYLLKLMFCL